MRLRVTDGGGDKAGNRNNVVIGVEMDGWRRRITLDGDLKRRRPRGILYIGSGGPLGSSAAVAS